MSQASRTSAASSHMENCGKHDSRKSNTRRAWPSRGLRSSLLPCSGASSEDNSTTESESISVGVSTSAMSGLSQSGLSQNCLSQNGLSQIFKYPNIQISKYSNIQISKYSNIQISKYPNIQISKYPNIQIFKYPNIQIFKYPNIQIFKYSKIQIFRYSNIQRRQGIPRALQLQDGTPEKNV